MKKKTLYENQDLLREIKEKLDLTQSEINDAAAKFQRYDNGKIGFIQKHEIDDVMRDLNLLKDDRVIQGFRDEVKSQGLKGCDFMQLCQLICKIKDIMAKIEEDESITGEYIDVFVAMGGNYDRSGFVQKDAIINIIKSEFELTFDMEQLLNTIGNNNQLDFQDFCQVFENAQDDGRSVISTISEKVRKQVDEDGVEEVDNFKVKYKDFERWCKQMEGQQQRTRQSQMNQLSN